MDVKLINLEPVKNEIKQKLIERYESITYMNTNSIDIKLDIKDILTEYISKKNILEPRIFITTDAYIKMRQLVDSTNTEIGWYGTVTKAPGLPNAYIIEDILVYPQTVTGATCEQDEDRIFEFEMSLSTTQVNTRRFQGHSHVNMGVTPSGVDEQFYTDLLTQVTDYYIIAVTNKRNDLHLRFYDIENNLLFTNVELKVLLNNGVSVDAWATEAKKALKERTYTAPTTDNFKGSIFDDEDSEWFKRYNGYLDYVRPKKDKHKSVSSSRKN